MPDAVPHRRKGAGQSQFFSLATSVGTTSPNFYFARPNDLTIIVNVIGFVERPGRYKIASSIDLINLISLAGGPTPKASLSKVTVIHNDGKGEKNHAPGNSR